MPASAEKQPLSTLRTMSMALAAALLLAVAPGAHPAHAVAPLPLPADRLHFGVSNAPDSLGWMTGTGVPWRYRYAYLAGGVNTGTGWQTWQEPGTPGLYATRYMDSSRGAGYIPVFSYYMLLQSNPSTGADEAARDYNNLNNASTMTAYYSDFKLLMQRAGGYGGPLVVQVEPDLWGYLQQRSGNTTPDRVAAAVTSSGNSEVAGLPDTAQGFAQGLLRMRDRYAPNVQMAIHASLWSSMQDIGSSTDPNLDPVAEAAKTVTFLNPAGIAGNPYGTTWDIVFDDVDDHDAAWWEKQGALVGPHQPALPELQPLPGLGQRPPGRHRAAPGGLAGACRQPVLPDREQHLRPLPGQCRSLFPIPYRRPLSGRADRCPVRRR